MKTYLPRLAVLAMTGWTMLSVTAPQATAKRAPGVLSYTVNDIDGKPVKLSRYKGKALLIVNTASLCGFTPQYAALQTLYDKYHKQGFEVLAFPANDFKAQEPGDNAQIQQFCSTTYHVTFPLFAKSVVKGEGQSPLYAYLTGKDTDPQFSGEIEWNFAKFLINRKGEVIARYAPKVSPTAPGVVAEIERALAAKR